MIDVFEQIKPLLTFESKDDYYFLQILMRKKDNPKLKSNGRLIKSYYIKSIEYLENRYDEIKKLCNTYNARASLRLNKRSFQQTALKTMELILKTGMNSDWEFARKAYDRAAGKGHNDKEKKWIIDLDDISYDVITVVDNDLDVEQWRVSKPDFNKQCSYFKNIITNINNQRPEGNKIKAILPTKSGIHLITRPFDLNVFSTLNPDIDIHKDNPINLYIP